MCCWKRALTGFGGLASYVMLATYIIHKNKYLSLLESLRQLTLRTMKNFDFSQNTGNQGMELHSCTSQRKIIVSCFDLSLKVHLRRLHFQRGVDHSFPLFKPINVGSPEKPLGKLKEALLINGNQSEGPIRTERQ